MNVVLYFFLGLSALIIFFYNSKKISSYTSLYKKINDSTPLVGGLGIYLFFILGVITLYFTHYELVIKNLWVIILVTSIFLIGIFDDIFNISYKIRLLSIFLIIFIILKIDNRFVVEYLYFKSLDKTFVLGDFSFYITPIFIMLLLNSINMADGINGNSGLIFLYFFILIFDSNNQLNLFLILIAVALVVFLIFNLKNLLYLGDSGVYFISTFISLYLIEHYKTETTNFACEEIFLILMIPGIDMFRLFCIRIYQKKNPFKGDLNHLHHLLINKFNLTKSLILYGLLVLWPFSLNSIFNILVPYLIFINLLIYSFLIFYLKKN